jgi:2-polyprenyl-3-methyl-5-hydroxy-6-metoxy-1,4-benzoquinol methylase
LKKRKRPAPLEKEVDMEKDEAIGPNAQCPLCGVGGCQFYTRHNRAPLKLYRCQGCGLFFVYPHNSQIPSMEYDRRRPRFDQFWRGPQAQAAFDRWRNWENEELASLILMEAKGGRLLEIGFGEGPLTEHLLPSVAEYWGIEPDEGSYQRTMSRMQLDATRSHCLQAEALDKTEPFANLSEYFDAVAMVSVFEHISNPGRVLESCHRLLMPGGRLFLSTPDSTHFKWILKIRRMAGMESWSRYHISFFNQHNLEMAFRTSGFTVKRMATRPLINALSARYFGALTRNRLIDLAMRGFSGSGLDRFLRIQCLVYVLEK